MSTIFGGLGVNVVSTLYTKTALSKSTAVLVHSEEKLRIEMWRCTGR